MTTFIDNNDPRIKLLFVNDGIHHKNLQALQRYDKIQIDTIHSPNDIIGMNLDKYDCVYSPGNPVNINLFPNTKFIFGPQFSVFPDEKIRGLARNNVAYIILSDWCKKLYETFPITKGLRLEPIPFGVDTQIFREVIPREKRFKVFIYHKFRNPYELQVLTTFLQVRGVDATLFSYNQKYNEQDYIRQLQESKFGIWFGCHESQGFALQEALSCNVPLLVWSVRSMSQEYGSTYPYVPATTVSYWDERCGEYFHDPRELETTYNKFIENLPNYRPREFVLENLSVEVCQNKFIDLIKNLE